MGGRGLLLLPASFPSIGLPDIPNVGERKKEEKKSELEY
jgi:hypothetical protein